MEKKAADVTKAAARLPTVTTGSEEPHPQISKLAESVNHMDISAASGDREESKENKDRSSGGSGSKSSQRSSPSHNYTYNADRIIGNGSFGVVYQATIVETGEVVAIKKVFQDKRYKNRELQIMKELRHPNVVSIKHAFFTPGDKSDELYLNVVMEYVPDTVYRIMKHYVKMKQSMPLLYVKLYAWQLCRSLAYIHCCGVCHRDIKPQNLLVDTSSHVLKLCDFGSAKKLIKGEPNVAYICSRYYRAPELIFGSTSYTTTIDIWSAGCVIAEMLLGQPLFPGESGVDQLVEIIKVLGTPTREQIIAMNQNYTEFKFPQIKSHPWSKVFRSRVPPEAIDLVSKLLQYNPELRLKPLEALLHPFFDELRDRNTTLSSNRPLPPLFNFTREELYSAPDIAHLLVPEWARDQCAVAIPLATTAGSADPPAQH